MKTILLVLIIALLTGKNSTGQNSIDNYIKEGLENNLALKQQKENFRISLLSLKEAVSLYYPSVSINARYSVADGGRIIELPVGDLLNPVYSTLNQLTYSESFPQIENEETNFLRPREHETKLRMTQTIFNPAVYYNSKIKSNLVEAELINIDSYKRELIAEIKKAYYNYLKTVEINKILIKTETVLNENIRVNQKLFENNKVTIDAVYRSQSELSELQTFKAQALKSEKSAAAYFNFLLNKPLNSPIEIQNKSLEHETPVNLEDSKENAELKREELKSLMIYNSIAENNLMMNRGAALPSVYAVVDYGFQGSEYKFNNEQDFVMASLVLSWDIFKGFGNKSKIQKAKLEKEIISIKTEEAKNRIELQVIAAYYETEACAKEIISSQQQVQFASEAYKIIEKKYKEGLVNLLQYIDARTNLTNAELNEIIAFYDYKIKYADYEKAAALYTLNI